VGFDYGLKTGLRSGFLPEADPPVEETLSKARSAASKLADHAIDIIA